MLIVTRTIHIVPIIEHLNSFGSSIRYAHTGTSYMGTCEYAAIDVRGGKDDLDDIRAFLTHWYSGDDFMILNYIFTNDKGGDTIESSLLIETH